MIRYFGQQLKIEMGVEYNMKFRHLHTYPKVFNTQGNLKTFPFRKPIKLNFWNTFWVSMAYYFLFVSFFHWNYSKFTKKDFFQKDKTQLLLRKRSFDSLILANKIQSSSEQVRERSIF